MFFLLPLFSAISAALSLTIDKVTLSFRRITYRTYAAFSFPLTFLVVLVVFIIVRPPFLFVRFGGNNWWLLLILIGTTIGSNLLFYRALDDDKLGEIETIDLLKTFPIILVSSIVFADERSPVVIVGAFIAAAAVVWSHWERHHLRISPYTLPYVLCVLSIEPARALATKLLLMSWHPLSLELVRMGAVALILGVVYAKHRHRITTSAFFMFIATSILYTASWLAIYISYERLGVIYTTLILTLQPLLVYLASIFFLRERVHGKKVIAFGIVLITITVVQALV